MNNNSHKFKIKDLKISVFKSGIKKNKTDLLLISLPKNSSVAGVFTKSSASSAAVNFCKKNIKNKRKNIRTILVNSGNANTFKGNKGVKSVQSLLSYLANKMNCDEKEIYTASTGVIGEFLDPNIIINEIEKNNPYSMDCWNEAAKAIMTTDTFHKVAFDSCIINNQKINLIGIAKGSGMIAPNMATMLSFIFTDANISSEVLQKILDNETEKSFNSITVDSDTSTSDTVLLTSTNSVKTDKIIDVYDKNIKEFKTILSKLMINLAKQIVIDGEGAKKIIHIKVLNAISKNSAKKIGMSIANSPLVKTAIAGEDANWGRIIMAIGKTYEKMNLQKIKIYFEDELVTSNGMKHKNYSEKKVTKFLQKSEVNIKVDMGMGSKSWSVYTCDLTENYIKINADYRS